MPSDLRKPLPEPGNWDGPVFGRLGVLATDGQRVECHACGRWFHHLGHHVRQTHNLTADEYRALFGLNVRTGLALLAIQTECLPRGKHQWLVVGRYLVA